MASAWQFVRMKAKAVRVGLGGAGGVGAAYLWNASESWRMAQNICQGRHRPDQPAEFISQYSVFAQENIEEGLRSNGMVALIGLKSTGKTTTLVHWMMQADNPLFVEVSNDDVYGNIYRELKRKVWSLPWLADCMRVDAVKDHKARVKEVFLMVKKQSGKPVQLGVDINFENKSFPLDNNSMANKLWEVTSVPPVPSPTGFDPVLFIKRVKYLVEDCHTAKAMLSSSEGLQLLAVNEPRLRKILGKELPVDTAADYLRNILGAANFDKEMLYQFPRTFACLKAFAAANNKDKYCKGSMDDVIGTLKTASLSCTGAKSLYKAALSDPVDVAIVQRNCESVAKFEESHVKSNIFVPCPGGYELQFDCMQRAAKSLFVHTVN
jgi:hypothetical protein